MRSLPRSASDASSGPTSNGETIDRRFTAARAGLTGDVETARSLYGDVAPAVRAAALGALVRLAALTISEAERAIGDDDPAVRRVACELGVSASIDSYLRALSDPVPAVVEAAAFALGERGDSRAVVSLTAVATDHPDPLCRESAVAALGAIGAPEGLVVILRALEDLPAIRRRAVIALAPFSGNNVEAALRLRLEDRDWQVRQAAEDLLGLSEEPTD